jgi:hypothetical protein
VLDILGAEPSLKDPSGVTMNQPIHFTAPREVRAGLWWHVYDDDTARARVAEICQFVQRWTIPFMNTYTTPAALVHGYKEPDERLPHDRRFLLFVVAALTLLNRPTEAMAVLEEHFGRPGARRQYARVFDYVSKLGAKTFLG